MELYYYGKNYLIIEGIDPETKEKTEIYTIYRDDGDCLYFVNYFYFNGNIEDLEETCKYYIEYND